MQFDICTYKHFVYFTHTQNNFITEIAISHHLVKLEYWQLTCQLSTWWSPDCVQLRLWLIHLRLTRIYT